MTWITQAFGQTRLSSHSRHVPAHIGVLDWGIGGFDFAARFRMRFPEAYISYLSDAGFPPYGTVAEVELVSRLVLACSFLAARGVHHIVIACNAASSVLDKLQALWTPSLFASERQPSPCTSTVCPTGVSGVINSTLQGLLALPPCRIVIVGGRRTIESECYQRPLLAAGFAVQAAVAQPLSALVEEGYLAGPALETALEDVTRGLESAELLVPACTHYVAVLAQLQLRLRPRAVVDPVTLTLDALVQQLAPRFISPPDTKTPSRSRALLSNSSCYTTGSPDGTRYGALKAFGLQLPDIRRVPVDLSPGSLPL